MEALLVVWKNAPLVALLLYAVATVSLAIFLERWFSVRRSKLLPKNWKRIKLAVASGHYEEAIRLLQGERGLVAKIVLQLLKLYAEKGATKGELLQILAQESELIYANLARGVSFLSISVTLATLLGLIGTVFGLIDVFKTFTFTSPEGLKLLAKGIATSLNSTAAGLLVAIITYFLYWIAKERVNSVYAKLVAEIEALIALLK